MKTLETPVDPAGASEEASETVDVRLPDTPPAQRPDREPELAERSEARASVEPDPEAPTRLDLACVDGSDPGAPDRSGLAGVDGADPEAPTRPDLASVDTSDPAVPTRLDLASVDSPDPEAPTPLDLASVDTPDPDAPTRLDLAPVDAPDPDAPTRSDLASVDTPDPEAPSRTDLASVDTPDPEAPSRADLASVDTLEPVAPSQFDLAPDPEAPTRPGLGRHLPDPEAPTLVGLAVQPRAEGSGEEEVGSIEPTETAERGAASGQRTADTSDIPSLTSELDEGATGQQETAQLGHLSGQRSSTRSTRGQAWRFGALRAHPFRWGALGGLCLLALVAVRFWPPATVGEEEGDQPSSGDVAQEQALEAFEEGVRLVHQRDWWGAALRFAEAAALDPSNPEPPAFLERVRREAGDAERLDRAKRCLDGGDLGCAREELDGIDRRSLVFEDMGAALLSSLEEKEAEQRGPGAARGLEAHAADAGERPAAGRSSPAGQEDGAVARAGGEEPGRLPRRASASARGAAPSSAGRQAAGATSTKAPRVQAGVKGEPVAEASEATPRSDPAEEALRHLQAAIRARARGNLESAALHLERALGAAPEEPLVLKELDDLRAMLPGLFREAYASRTSDPDGAREKLRLVIRFSAPGSELRTKAEKWLGRLEDRP